MRIYAVLVSNHALNAQAGSGRACITLLWYINYVHSIICAVASFVTGKLIFLSMLNPNLKERLTVKRLFYHGFAHLVRRLVYIEWIPSHFQQQYRYI